MHLLEAEAPDSLLRWGFFNAIFEQKEAADARVLEQLAREMLSKDAALKAEFEARLRDGFYTPEERIYQLKGQLLRAARVRIDTGLHTERMTFDEAVGYLTANVDLLPGACDPGGSDPTRAAVCQSARRAIYRYSKWPTQAITYHLGKRQILDLRDRIASIQGDRFSLREFHERFLSVGTIPVGYVRDRLLDEVRER